MADAGETSQSSARPTNLVASKFGKLLYSSTEFGGDNRMHQHYIDILETIDRPPTWFDEHAVPRYCIFEPSRAASIYADEVALVEILCQGCGHPFSVAFSHLNVADMPIKDAIQSNTLHFGDPPNIRCCAAGACMNSLPRRVLQYWRRHDETYTEPSDRSRRATDQRFFEWARDGSLEIPLTPPWEK